MKIFVDTSTLLAAAGSARGLSRLMFEQGATADYCVTEVERNLGKVPGARAGWSAVIRPRLETVPSVFVFDYPVVFEVAKDRPVLLSALGCAADFLVTSDKRDFAHVLGTTVYGVRVRTPETFLLEMGVLA